MNRTDIYLWEVEKYLMRKYGCDEAERTIYPLRWYVYTGRASGDFLQRLRAAKPFMIARRLYNADDKSHDGVIRSVKAYLHM